MKTCPFVITNATVPTRCCHKLDRIKKPIVPGKPSTLDQNGVQYVTYIVLNGFSITDGDTQSFGI